MYQQTIKTSVKTGIATALAIILFQVCNLFLVYHYFRYDYYLTATAVTFLLAGFFISRRQKPAENNGAGDDPLVSLTSRELSVLQLIIDGKSNKQIAAINYIELSTVKTHINNIYAKLGLQNRKEAIARYGNRTIRLNQIGEL
jgi:DNA-binding CsgD family transcriptional regulator